LRQPGGKVADTELVQQVLELGRRQIQAEVAQQALQSAETVDARPASEAAEKLAEQALAGYCVDRDDDGAGLGLAVQINDEAEQVQV
jgi:hypothetical protein